MIRLTINSNSNPEIHLYDKPTILIGSDINNVDLILTKDEIYPIHLTITSEGSHFFLINDHNDPFVVVNDHPFGKKKLKNEDVIEIYGTTITYENLEEKNPLEAPAKTVQNGEDEELETASLYPEPLHTPFKFTLPFEDDVKALDPEELNQEQLNRYFKDLDKKSLSSTQEAKSERKKTSSLKDDYLRDLDDDYPNKMQSFPVDESSHLIQAWKWIILFIVSVLLIFGLIGTVIYFSVSDKTDAQEIKASQAVADLAIALTHAQLNHMYSHNPNWSDTEFLKGNLNAILPDSPSYAYQIDAQGKFNCCPYNLRIYTSANLSHFLLIAQPEPNVMHWLIPKSMIVVDSQSMELRTIKDVRSLNRLLANPDPLEGTSSKEISALVKTGGLIRLQILANESGKPDFAPPKSLSYLKPGAENYIYNAPRYYRLGQGVMERIIALSNSKTSSQEVASIKTDVANLCCLSNLVFYSTQGKYAAHVFKQGLMLFAPSENFLYGYLTFTNKGVINQAHLLKEDEEPKEEHEAELIALKEESVPTHAKINPNETAIDSNHPIYIKLHAMIMARQNEIRPLSDELVSLIQQELNTPSPAFQNDYQNLSHDYLIVDAKHKRMIKEAIETLYLQYEEMPVSEFVTFLKALSLQKLIHESEEDVALSNENITQNIESILKKFGKSETLEELDHLIHMVSTLLNFDYIKDSDDLVLYQNQLRNLTLIELEKHILLSDDQTTEEDRDVLLHILDQERLIHPEEKAYFLEEFDGRGEKRLPREYEWLKAKDYRNEKQLSNPAINIPITIKNSLGRNDQSSRSYPSKATLFAPGILLEPKHKSEAAPSLRESTAFMRPGSSRHPLLLRK